MPPRLLKLDVSSYTGRFYVGNVLDLIRAYLNLGVRTYIASGGGRITEWRSAKMDCECGRIVVLRNGQDNFIVDGFPENGEGKFEEFQGQAQKLLEDFFSSE